MNLSAVNTQMVLAYRLIGREIVEELQGGEERAAYGKKVVEALSARLIERYGKGFCSQASSGSGSFTKRFRIAEIAPRWASISEKRLGMGDKSLETPIQHTPGDETPLAFSLQLTWSHYRALMCVDNVEFLRAKGATYDSPGQHPGFAGRQHDSALKRRQNCRYQRIAFSGLEWINAMGCHKSPRWGWLYRVLSRGAKPCLRRNHPTACVSVTARRNF